MRRRWIDVRPAAINVQRPTWWFFPLAGLSAALAGIAGVIDLLGGSDARWSVGASLLLVLPAIALLAEIAPRGDRPSVALAALGPPVVLFGALLGDAVGASGTWLVLAALWWLGVARGVRGSRPGLALLSIGSAIACLVAAVLVTAAAPQPLASVAGARAVLAVAWSGWAGVELLGARSQ